MVILSKNVLSMLFAATLAIGGVTALVAPAAAAPCYSAPNDPATACVEGASGTAFLLLCDEGGGCFGVVSFAEKEVSDVQAAIACSFFVPVGTARCIEDKVKDPLGHNVDRFGDSAYMALFKAQFWALPIEAQKIPSPYSGDQVPNIGPTLAGVEVIP